MRNPLSPRALRCPLVRRIGAARVHALLPALSTASDAPPARGGVGLDPICLVDDHRLSEGGGSKAGAALQGSQTTWTFLLYGNLGYVIIPGGFIGGMGGGLGVDVVTRRGEGGVFILRRGGGVWDPE